MCEKLSIFKRNIEPKNAFFAKSSLLPRIILRRFVLFFITSAINNSSYSGSKTFVEIEKFPVLTYDIYVIQEP